MRTSRGRRALKKPGKSFAWMAILVLLASYFAIQQGNAAQANTATIADVTNNCQVAVTSGSITVDNTSTAIALVGNRCVVRFLSPGAYTVTIPTNISAVDYLVVGGGGGGGSGGGGGGGVMMGTNFAVTPGNSYGITIGAGGIGGSGGAATHTINATNGSQSVFATVTATGGGSGGQGNQNPGNGSSGGGARYDCTSISCIGLGTPGQGNNGAASTHGGYGGGAGGGGAGSAGGNTTLYHIGGRGGDGLPTSITGAQTYFGAGGGGGINENTSNYGALNSPGTSDSNYFTSSSVQTTGGGAGGLGGGGRGSSYGFQGGNVQGQYTNCTPGVANTGGGGGGTDPEDAFACAGGSGIVVLSFSSPASLKTIAFDANSGSGTTPAQSVESGLTTQLSANRFTRGGFVFQGWNTAADGTGTPYANLANITVRSPLTLYAQWAVGINHTVTFDPNLGTGSQYTQLAGLPTNLFANTFNRAGYTFTGWNSRANGTGYPYTELGIYSFYEDQTLYAQWAATATLHTVSFYGNGSTGGSTLSQTANSAKPLNANGFTRTGYNFLGWNISNGATTAGYLDLQSYSFSADLSLYAIWVTSATYTVTFNGNTSTSGTMANQASSTATSLTANAFIKDGSTFLGWNTAANGTGTSYPAGYIYNFGASVTLYAKWGQNFTVDYSGNTNSGGTAPASQNSYVGGTALNLGGNPQGLVKTGAVFAGWNTQANGTGTPYSIWQFNVVLNSGATLYAQWSAATYTVSYQGNSNTSGSVAANQTYVYGGSTITVDANSGQLVRDGYRFLGWNTAPDGTGTNYAAGAGNATFTSDTVLFANWYLIPPPPLPAVTSQSTFVANPNSVTQLILSGIALGKVSRATIGGVDAQVSLATDDQVIIILPGGFSGVQPLVIYSADGSFRYDSAIEYKSKANGQTTSTGIGQGVNVTVSGFAAGSSALTDAMKARISALVKASGAYKSITCTGYTEGPTVLNVDAQLSRDRAVNVCRYAVAQSGKALTLASIASAQERRQAASVRRVVIKLNQ